MEISNKRPREHPEVSLASEVRYIAGFAITVTLMGFSLVLVRGHALSPTLLVLAIAGVAALAVLAQLVLLFHLDFSEVQIWNTLTLALNVPLLILSIGLTAWMFRTLYIQVMMPALTGSH